MNQILTHWIPSIYGGLDRASARIREANPTFVGFRGHNAHATVGDAIDGVEIKRARRVPLRVDATSQLENCFEHAFATLFREMASDTDAAFKAVNCVPPLPEDATDSIIVSDAHSGILFRISSYVKDDKTVQEVSSAWGWV